MVPFVSPKYEQQGFKVQVSDFQKCDFRLSKSTFQIFKIRVSDLPVSSFKAQTDEPNGSKFEVLFFDVSAQLFLLCKNHGFSQIEEKNGTMIQGAKNAARCLSSFLCSLSVALFRDVLEML